VINRDSVIGSREGIAVNGTPYHNAQAERGALLQEIPAADSDFCLSHSFLLRRKDCLRKDASGAQKNESCLSGLECLAACHCIDGSRIKTYDY
jgi:hypothetical protein